MAEVDDDDKTITLFQGTGTGSNYKSAMRLSETLNNGLCDVANKQLYRQNVGSAL